MRTLLSTLRATNRLSVREVTLRCDLQVGADIVKRALSYPLKLIAKNAGVNGSVVSEKVIETSLVFTFVFHF